MPQSDKVQLDNLRKAQKRQGNDEPLNATEKVVDQQQDVSPRGLAQDEDRNPMN